MPAYGALKEGFDEVTYPVLAEWRSITRRYSGVGSGAQYDEGILISWSYLKKKCDFQAIASRLVFPQDE
jgi:hypothetical protein